jgi:hypothetical protein
LSSDLTIYPSHGNVMGMKSIRNYG